MGCIFGGDESAQESAVDQVNKSVADQSEESASDDKKFDVAKTLSIEELNRKNLTKSMFYVKVQSTTGIVLKTGERDQDPKTFEEDQTLLVMYDREMKWYHHEKPNPDGSGGSQPVKKYPINEYLDLLKEFNPGFEKGDKISPTENLETYPSYHMGDYTDGESIKTGSNYTVLSMPFIKQADLFTITDGKIQLQMNPKFLSFFEKV